MINEDSKPILFLFKKRFTDNKFEGEEFFCPFCIQVEGFLCSFPEVREEIDIRYVGFDKPRGDLPLFCGEAHQSCPQIVLPDGDDQHSTTFSEAALGHAKKIAKTTHILDYLSGRFSTPRRHP